MYTFCSNFCLLEEQPIPRRALFLTISWAKKSNQTIIGLYNYADNRIMSCCVSVKFLTLEILNWLRYFPFYENFRMTAVVVRGNDFYNVVH